MPADTTPPRCTAILPIPGGTWSQSVGLTEITLRFDEPVLAPEGSIRAWFGASSAKELDVEVVEGRNPSELIVRLPTAARNGLLTVVADYSITDLAGNALDGELSSIAGANFPSGDSRPGGQLVVQFRVIGGDANGDGVVNGADLSVLLFMFGQPTTPSNGADFNGDGVVNGADLSVLLAGFGSVLDSDDGVRPAVASITPTPGQPLEQPLSNVIVDFSEAVTVDRLSPRTLFVVTEGGGVLTPASGVALSSDGRQATFTLPQPVGPCGSFRVGISPAIADLSGALLTPPPVAPQISGLLPPPAPTIDPTPDVTATEFFTFSGQAPRGTSIEIVSPAGAITTPVVSGAFSATIQLPADQLSTISFTSISQCGIRSALATRRISLDASPPTVFIEYPPANAQLTVDQVTVLGRVGDEFSGFKGLSVTVNGIPADVNIGGGNNGTFVAMNVPLNPTGQTAITATATDILGNERATSINITRFTPPPGSFTMAALGGDGQSAGVLGNLPDPLTVRVAKPDGSPFPNKVVTFQVVRNDGRLFADSSFTGEGTQFLQVFTDSGGLARAYWKLGSGAGAGNNRVAVSSQDIVGSVFFCASGIAAAADRIVVGDHNYQRAQAGATLPQPLRVLVTDGDTGNGVAGVPVTFTVVRGNGLFSDGLAQVVIPTSQSGHAEALFTLGMTPGLNEVEATFAGNPGLPAVFQATGLARVQGQPTTIEGVVLDNAGRAIGGALMTLKTTVRFSTGPAVFTLGPKPSDVEGRFVFDASDLPPGVLDTDLPAGSAKLNADARNPVTLNGEPRPVWTFPYVGYEMVIVEGAVNTLPTPIYLPEMDPANEVLYDGTQDVVLRVTGIDGLEFRVKAGSLTRENGSRPTPADPEILRLNQVHFDEVPMPLPDGNAFPFAWTLQPKNARFDPPVEVTLPNLTALPPGSIADILQWNNDTVSFQTMGAGKVSADGSVIVSDPGTGITVAGWGGAGPPPPPPEEVKECPDDVCAPNGCTASPDQWVFYCTDGGADYLPFASCPPPAIFGATDCVMIDFASLACNAHDLCYVNCNGPSREVCDDLFEAALLASCELTASLPCGARTRELCRDTVWAYVRAVRNAGAVEWLVGDFFDRPHCESCACGGPTPGASTQAITMGSASLDSPPFPDADLDGIDDRWEIEFGLDPSNTADAYLDFDNDDLPNFVEFLRGSDPNVFDSLQPGVSDGDVVWQAQPPPPLTLGAGWTVQVEGTAAAVSPAGTYELRSVPRSDRLVRVTGSARSRGRTMYYQSDYFAVTKSLSDVPGGEFSYSAFPRLVQFVVAAQSVVAPGDSLQLAATGMFSDATTADVTARIKGTSYTSSNPAIASVSENGLVSALSNGTAFIFASNEGTSAVQRIDVTSSITSTTVVGTVLLPDGSPAAGAQVTTLPFGGSATASSDGSFILTLNVPSDALLLQVRASLAGTSPSSSASVPVADGGFTDAGVIRLGTPFSGPLFPGEVFATGLNPTSVTSADLDGDGDLELAVANRWSNTVSVLENIGNGAFAPRNDFAVGSDPTSVTATDLDGDGDLDLAVVNGDSDTVSVLLNTGNGNFAARTDFAVGSDPTSVTATDLDGDGDQDLAVVNSSSDTVSVLLNTGNGTFALLTDLATDSIPWSITSADFDGDSDQDIAVVNRWSHTVSVLLNTGNGSFAPRTDFATGGGPQSVTAADLDGDGDLDLAVANRGSNTVSVLLHTGNGSFATAIYYVTGEEPISVTCADLDGDGDLDLVVANSFSGTVSVLLNGGNGSFAPWTDFATGGGPQSVTAADFDGDGDRDLAVASSDSNSVSVLDNIGAAGFAVRTDFATGDRPLSVATADFDGDGDVDLAVANSSSDSVSVLLSTGDGGFAPPADFATGRLTWSVTAADLDGDGDQDLAVANRNSRTVSVLLNTGTGSFAPQTEFAAGASPVSIASADLDDDGDQDLVVANEGSSTVSVLLNIGNGSFAARTDFATDGGSQSVTAADLDGDGDQDIAVASSTVSVLLNTGSGSFAPRLDFAAGSGPRSVTAADLDGDGDQDLAVANSGDSTVSVLLNTGNGSFASRADFTTGFSPWSITTADLDGDGDLDLAVANEHSNTVSIVLNIGSGGFALRTDFVTGSDPRYVTAADFDGDGDQDLAVANRGSNTLSVLPNRRIQAQPATGGVLAGGGWGASPTQLARAASLARLADDHGGTGSTGANTPPRPGAGSIPTSASGRGNGLRAALDAAGHAGLDVAKTLGTLGGEQARVLAMADDGGIAVGWSTTRDGWRAPFIWTQEIGMRHVSELADPRDVPLMPVGSSEAVAIDADHRVSVRVCRPGVECAPVSIVRARMTPGARADIDADGAVTVADLRRVIEDIGTDCLPCDINLDGRVDGTDVVLLLTRIGPRN